MGCFLGCFGAPKDRRRRRRRDRVQLRDHGTASHDHSRSLIFSIPEFPEKSTIPSSEILEQGEKSNLSTSRKRVTFDTNVKAYEHVLPEESLEFRHEKEEITNPKENLAKTSQSQSSSGNSSITSSSGSYPPNHRYRNCREIDDEEEYELDYEESDLDDDDVCDEDGCDMICPDKGIYTEEVVDNVMDGLDDENMGVKPRGSSASARDRSGYVHPVLNPVENLTQWKAVKGKGRTINLNPQKENLVSDQEKTQASFGSDSKFQEISFSFKPEPDHEAKKTENKGLAVDASLSTWLSPSEATFISNSVHLDAATPEKSVSQVSNSSKSLEDRPILGALTVEEIKKFSASPSPRKSPSRSPDETPIIGSVGSYWNHSVAAKTSGSASSIKGIPNTTSKYREDKRVNWHSTPFETRLERALNSGVNVTNDYSVCSTNVH